MEKWENARISPPKKSGFYVISKINDASNGQFTSFETALFLKKGEEYISRSVPCDLSKTENKLMFSVCKYDVIIKAPQSGFYEVRKTDDGGSILRFLKQEDIIWTNIPDAPSGAARNEYDVIKERLKKYHDSTDIEKHEVYERIRDFLREESKLKNVIDSLKAEFASEFYTSCGVRYVADVDEIEKAFLRALIIRDNIRSLSSFKKIGEIYDISFNRENIGRYSVNRALNLREELCKFMADEGVPTDNISLISDAFFTFVFLPTKKDILKVFYKDEKSKENKCDDKNVFYTKLYQRYMVNNAVRMVEVAFNGRKEPNDSLLDTIALKDLSIAMAIQNFGISNFLDSFKDEMGI